MQNPLLTPTQPIAFDRLHATDVEPTIELLLVQAQTRIEAIAAECAAPTYASTLEALEATTAELEFAQNLVQHIESVATDAAWRRATTNVLPRISEFYAKLPLHGGLWRRLQAFAATPEAALLDGTRQRLLHKTLDTFRRHGADLSEEGKVELAAIDVELSQLTTQFSQNLLDATAAFELIVEEEAKLAGLPKSARDAARLSAAAKNMQGWRFSLQGPSLTAALTYLDDAALRQQLWQAAQLRAAAPPHDNRPLIEEILRLRHAKARLLGFDNFAAFILSDRMAKTPQKAHELLDALHQACTEAFARENDELQRFRSELAERPNMTAAASPLAPWDIGYYAEKQRQSRYAFDEEELRAYFPAEGVLRGLFELTQRIFGIRVQEATLPTWHADVRSFALHDADGTLLANFYVDLYPRENKRDGAWMQPLFTGTPRAASPQAHAIVFCANASPPTDDRPALLLLREVETLFHEFGHLLHHALTEVPVRSLAGTQVAWDFVELPSQIMENWVWQREALDLFASHYQSSATLPDELLQKVLRSRTYRSGNAMMRQLGLATVDLALHVDYAPAPSGDALAFARPILAAYAATPLPPDYAMLPSFGHLFADPVGYAAGYYSYKWAEVLEADAFDRFRREGVLNADTGRAYRQAILAQGDARPPEELFEAFVGRPPRIEALLQRQGLA